MYLLRFIGISIITFCMLSCDSSGKKELDLAFVSNDANISAQNTSKQRTIPADFGEYWYKGTAEITSYKLTQSRYGELRDGTAVTIFVTEDFDASQQVKSDSRKNSNIPMLKLNLTKKFNTGIYPYSIMTSVFNPVNDTRHSLKIANSVQEWCGQTYMQLNNREQFEIQANSYFQSEGDQNVSLEKNWLEDEIWNLIRLNPTELPKGEFKSIPSFEYIRLAHKEVKAYATVGEINKGEETSDYSISYPELKRKLTITFTNDFPHTIEKWEETHANGQLTKGEKIKRIQSPYWSKNANKFVVLRDSLRLK